MRKSQKGFTLIEILIVVAIIGILASVALVGLRPVQSKGRDARRISDLRQVQAALELYFSKNGQYPAATDWCALTTTLTGASIGVSKVPNDPTAPSTCSGSDTRNYKYGTSGTPANNYVVGATLEDTANSVLNDDLDGTVNGVSCVDPLYCIQL